MKVSALQHQPKPQRVSRSGAPNQEAAQSPTETVQLSALETVSRLSEAPARPTPSKWLEVAKATCETVTYNLTPVLFLSDLDGTWRSPDPANRARLNLGVQQLKESAREQGIDLQFGYISARPLERIVSEELPQSDWMVVNNGGFIYTATPEAADVKLDQTWETHKLAFGFSAEHAMAEARKLAQDPRFAGLEFSTVGSIVNNPAADGCPDIATFCISNGSIQLGKGEKADQLDSHQFKAPRQVDSFAKELTARLRKQGAHFKASPVYPFHGQPYVMFDLASVDKGDAIQFLKDEHKLENQHVIIAGDGGNDIAMMRDPKGRDDGRRAIVVGANSALRSAATEVSHAIVQPSDMDCSLGVLAGLKQHLGEIADQLAKR